MPLMKKGHAEDAKKYKTIALLQSGYKVVAKMLCHRA